MAGETKTSRLWLQVLLWATSIGLGATLGFGLIPLLRRGDLPPWEDLLNAGLGLWLIACVPISILRWFAVPKARISNFIVRPLIAMALSGVCMVLPVLGPQVIDRTLCFIGVLAIYFGSMLLGLFGSRNMDELLRRMANDSAVMTYRWGASALFLYAAAERLGLISGLTAWGMVGLLMVLNFTAQFVAYYRLGMGPGSQSEAPA